MKGDVRKGTQDVEIYFQTRRHGAVGTKRTVASGPERTPEGERDCDEILSHLHRVCLCSSYILLRRYTPLQPRARGASSVRAFGRQPWPRTHPLISRLARSTTTTMVQIRRLRFRALARWPLNTAPREKLPDAKQGWRGPSIEISLFAAFGSRSAAAIPVRRDLSASPSAARCDRSQLHRICRYPL